MNFSWDEFSMMTISLQKKLLMIIIKYWTIFSTKGFIMEDVIFLIFGGWLDLTENERFFRKLFKIRNDQHYNTKLFCSQKVFPKLTICLIKHKIESENQIFGSRLLNRNMTTSIIKPLEKFANIGLKWLQFIGTIMVSKTS